MDEEKLIILVQGHECLYNLQQKDYNNLPHPVPGSLLSEAYQSQMKWSVKQCSICDG
jgi:hypothetical protein